MAKKEFVQLAHDYKRERDCIAGYFVSEKLDGVRGYWDGGITRGIPKAQVPWANTAKDERLLNPQISTGLWSRYGNVLHAPDGWLDQLPSCPLDGEMYRRGWSRQQIMSVIKKFAENRDDSKWAEIKLNCFDRPAYETTFADGKINNPNYQKYFYNILQWIEEHLKPEATSPRVKTGFESTYKVLKKLLVGNQVAIAHEQEQLPWHTEKAEARINVLLEEISEAGGEGLIVRSPAHPYVCERTYNVLKVKKIQDAEGTVIGYTTGRETDKGSKLLGKMGALIVEANYQCQSLDQKGVHKIIFEMSRFTDEERGLKEYRTANNDRYYPVEGNWAAAHPGEECPEWITNPKFPRGTTITFKYRGMSDDGIPQEARYYRKREEV